MTDSGKKVLKTALSYLQKHDGLSYDQALLKISRIIVSGDAENNPLYVHLLEAGLPGEPGKLNNLLAPGAING